MELTRRNFLTGMAAAAGGAMALGLAACSPEGDASEPAEGAEENTAAAVEHNPVDTETCDIVVVGSGTAGLAAAVRAAQLGANVILLEKNAYFGGSSGYAEGIGAVNTYMHREAGLEFDEDEVFMRTQEYHHWAADSAVLRRFIQNSGATVDWLHEECGINFFKPSVVSATSYPSWHLLAHADGTVARVLTGYVEPMSEYAVSIGVDARTNSPATGLICEDGQVKGVYFMGEDDQEHAIEAGDVILATGGYSNNKEMLEQFCQVDFDRIWNWGASGRDGDGIRWATEIGADLHIPSNLMYGCTHIPNCGEFEEPANWLFSWQPAMRVNEQGKRFFNEEICADFSAASSAIVAQQDAFTIMDTDFFDAMCDKGMIIGLDSVGYESGKPIEGAREVVEAEIEAGNIFRADTVEDLAGQLGIDPANLKATVDEYNASAKDGKDPLFGTTMFAPVKTAPFYGCNIQRAVFTSVGGLRVDEYLRVLDHDGNPIEHLFALGNDASSYTGHVYDVGVFAGAQQGWCATGGRLAAEYIMGA